MKKFITLALALGFSLAVHADSSQKDDDYDRLDGMGLSGKKVNVIEWGENLEVHVYPAGSLQGLSLVLDKKNKDKPVMVIGYRFNGMSKPLIRRAILGINLQDGFRAYRDTSAAKDGYDKIVISNSPQSDLVAFKLDTAPAQLYPDGHPLAASTTDDINPNERRPAADDPVTTAPSVQKDNSDVFPAEDVRVHQQFGRFH